MHLCHMISNHIVLFDIAIIVVVQHQKIDFYIEGNLIISLDRKDAEAITGVVKGV